MTESRQLPTEERGESDGVEPDGAQTHDGVDGELRLIVRKLELPVRPRGVLAE